MAKLPEMVMFVIPGTPPVIGNIIGETEHEITVDSPLLLIKEDYTVYSMPYLPLAKDNIVNFNKNMIISFGKLDQKLITYYEQMTSLYKEKSKNIGYKIEGEESEDPFAEIEEYSKTLH